MEDSGFYYSLRFYFLAIVSQVESSCLLALLPYSPIPFVIYVNDMPDDLFEASLLYTAVVKVIVLRNSHDILQSSLDISASWPNIRKQASTPLKQASSYW